MKKKYYVLTSFLAIVLSADAQIPNSGFESWTNIGNYFIPDSWNCLNGMTSPHAVYTCEKGTPGNPGTAYLKLTSKTVTGMGVIPGIAVCGTLNETTMLPSGGFAFNQRPANLTGKWQHMIYGSSQGYIDVQLTRWNGSTRIPVANAHYVLSGMAMGWASFTIPLSYNEGNNPDSCIIVLCASGSTPVNNDYLYVDDLSFSGIVAGLSDFQKNNQFRLFPNPTCNSISIDFPEMINRMVSLQIADVLGKVVKSEEPFLLTKSCVIDVSALPSGNYFLQLVTTKESYLSQFKKE